MIMSRKLNGSTTLTKSVSTLGPVKIFWTRLPKLETFEIDVCAKSI